jgi:hypothetical protein
MFREVVTPVLKQMFGKENRLHMDFYVSCCTRGRLVIFICLMYISQLILRLSGSLIPKV